MDEKDEIVIIDYFRDANLYNSREFVVFEVPDNYYYGVPKMKYMYFKSTNTSNALGSDLWYYTPGIGRPKDNYEYWIVKDSSDDMYHLIEYLVKYEPKLSYMADEFKKIKDTDDAFETILENKCVDLYDFGATHKDLYAKSWVLKLMSKLQELYNNYVLELLTNKELVSTVKKIKDQEKTKRVLSRIIPAQIPKLVQDIVYNNDDTINVSQDILNVKKYNMPCVLFTRYGFYHRLQLGLQLSHDIWDLLESTNNPLLVFIKNNDWDNEKFVFIPRSVPLKKIMLRDIRITKLGTDDEFKLMVNSMLKWSPDKYKKFNNLKYNETIEGGSSFYKNFLLF